MKSKEIIASLENSPGYFRHNNCHTIKVANECVEMRADLTETSLNPYGIVHGGLIFSLGDTAMGMAVGKKALTLSANISYLKPGTGKYIIAKAEKIKMGKNICFMKAMIYNDKEELIAIMDSSYYIVR